MKPALIVVDVQNDFCPGRRARRSERRPGRAGDQRIRSALRRRGPADLRLA